MLSHFLAKSQKFKTIIKRIIIKAAANAERVKTICRMVADGMTLREVGKKVGLTAGGIVFIMSENEGYAKQYARARDAASDLFEADIIDAANTVTNENANAMRVKIDALKWIAARRSPKRYSEKFSVDHTANGESLQPSVIEIVAPKDTN